LGLLQRTEFSELSESFAFCQIVETFLEVNDAYASTHRKKGCTMKGLLGFLKKHKTDYSSIKSHVLGEKEEYADTGDDFNTGQLSSANYDKQFGRGRFAKDAAIQGRSVGFGNEYSPEFEASLDPVQPLEMPRQEMNEPRGNYEVMDRLAFIENQLTAIKSQVELVNERLKNIDAKIGTRRY